ncbi:MAG: hypothetical protein CM1200mP13_00540 [Candidatus Pelagibacterales bacterium]|nr:MAG: hypothetical protein CM1200mP13_00540 [Pelagibacterales bacterium]
MLESYRKKARSVGFQNTIAAEGNVTNLKELIIQSYESKNKELLYVSGETISVDLDQQLLSEGFKVKRIINYRVVHNQKFDEKFVNELKLNMPDMVYVYSQNSASSFLKFHKDLPNRKFMDEYKFDVYRRKNLVNIERNQMEKDFSF